MWFTSDNAAGAAPEVLQALARVSAGHTGGYGDDEATARAQALIRDAFEAPEAAVYFVATGTAANSLALATLCPQWGGIYCHQAAHIEMDECGAPTFFSGGARMVGLPGAHGRIEPDALKAAIAQAGAGGVHSIQKGALSITNATEAGAIYDPAAVAELTAIARAADVPTHMDGTRFANAVAALGCAPADLSWRAGVDILCLGATKNGALAAEAVILFDAALAHEFELRRKQGGHLFSKMRFIAAQFEALMTDDLWLRNAARANACAARLSAGVAALPGAFLTSPTEANLIFAGMPRATHDRAVTRGAHYYTWPDGQPETGAPDDIVTCRIVCSSHTTDAEVDALLAAFAD